MYTEAYADHGSPQLQSIKQSQLHGRTYDYSGSIRIEKSKELLSGGTISNIAIKKINEHYIDYVEKILAKNNNARIWLSIPRYDKFLPYSKQLTDYHKKYFIDEILEKSSETNTINNIIGFCFETEQVNDYKYYVFDKTKINDNISVVSEKYKNRNSTTEKWSMEMIQ